MSEVEQNSGFEEAALKITNFLKNNQGVDGITIHEHLYRLFHKLFREPNKFTKDLRFLELLSDYVKKNSFNFTNPLSDQEVNNIPLKAPEHGEWIAKSQQLLIELKKQAIQKEQLLMPNFFEDSFLIDLAGIGFSEEESYRISTSVRQLADQFGATQMRFWGKYLSRGKDYYVAQGMYSNKDVDKLPGHCEQKGEGANKYTFWVTHDVLEEWTELPLIAPEHVVQARQIKYFCTGDLNAPVKTYPPFPGKEKHFLKAQLVRITYGSELVPKGLYRPPEEGEPDVMFEDEPFKLPEFSELQAAEAWVHLHPSLNKQGRASIYVDPKLSEEERETKKAEIAEADPDTAIERLRDIAQDKPPIEKPEGEAGGEEEETNWQKRQYGDLQQFNSLDEGAQLNYNCICFKNATWPGAYLISNSQSYCNIYVGYGFKFNQHPFLPVEPSDMLTEQEDTEEHIEPNPTNPPDEVESDSDAEKKEGEEDED